MTITPTTDNEHLIASLSPRRQEALRRLLAARAAKAAAANAITPRGEGPAPCSYEQTQMWLGARFAEGAPAPNATIGLRLTGPLDLRALTIALDSLVERHEILRTVYEGDGHEPRQVILDPGPAPLDVVDLRELPEAEREARPGRSRAGPPSNASTSRPGRSTVRRWCGWPTRTTC